MTGLSSAGEATVLNSLTTNCFVSLHIGDPGDTGANEIAGDTYTRQPSTFANSGGNPTIAANNAIVAFPVANVRWGTAMFFGVWTQASGGAFQGSGALTPNKLIDVGDQARFAVGALTITAD